MDPIFTEILQFAKVATPSFAVAVVFLGLFRLIGDLRQPRKLADAVKEMNTQAEKDALIELYRLHRMTKISGKPLSRRKSRP